MGVGGKKIKQSSGLRRERRYRAVTMATNGFIKHSSK